MLLMRQPLPIGSVLGNRTPDSAVRGLRLNLLTNTPYSLFIYAVQRKINYTEELPSCPVLFLFFSKLFWGPDGYGGVGRPEFVYENRIQWVFGQAYANRHRGIGRLRGCQPAGVCVRKPNSVGFRAGVRKPAPGRRPGTGVSAGRSLLLASREALCLRFGEQILHLTPSRKARFRRRPARPICSPLLAKPYVFVPGSKFFTQLPAGKCDFAGGLAGRFAPRSPLGLIPSFRGANSSHNFRPVCAVSPAARPAGLLPPPR